MDISCYWLSQSGHGGPTIPSTQMRRLVELNIELWFDFDVTDSSPVPNEVRLKSTRPRRAEGPTATPPPTATILAPAGHRWRPPHGCAPLSRPVPPRCPRKPVGRRRPAKPRTHGMLKPSRVAGGHC